MIVVAFNLQPILLKALRTVASIERTFLVLVTLKTNLAVFLGESAIILLVLIYKSTLPTAFYRFKSILFFFEYRLTVFYICKGNFDFLLAIIRIIKCISDSCLAAFYIFKSIIDNFLAAVNFLNLL